MRAVTIDFEHRSLRERDVPEPELSAPDQVLLRILEAGVCGTDRELANFQFGEPPEGDTYLVLGHEALAEVLQVGESVTKVRPGDLVAPMIRRACSPPCAQCAAGRRDLCLTGTFRERGITGAHGYLTELAVDRSEDLVPIPPTLKSFAVLAEPLSVVEKAVSRALALHQAVPQTALVIGAGSIGLLAAMALRLRGLEVDVCSVEPEQSARARLVEEAGAQYVRRPVRKADVVLEAAGSPDAVTTALGALGPLGVLVVLGALRTAEPVRLLDMILGNQVIAGTVNAGPDAFAQAVEDLPRMPYGVLSAMIERMPFSGFHRSLSGSPPAVPKIVHTIAE